MARLVQRNAAELDHLANKRLGLQYLKQPPSVQQCRFSALTLRELVSAAAGLITLPPSDLPPTPRDQPQLDEQLLLRRCGLPVIAKVSVLGLVQAFNAFDPLPTLEELVDFKLIPKAVLEYNQAKALLKIHDVHINCLAPMLRFCKNLQPQSAALDVDVCTRSLLQRCGWAEEAVQLVVGHLRWDTIELLHFALQQLRQYHTYQEIAIPLLDLLEIDFGVDAVRPLRKALNPNLTLALVAAAPEAVRTT